MKEKIVARYERQSTLWKNANGFYRAQDWTVMKCLVMDFTEELNSYGTQEDGSEGCRHFDHLGNDITEKIKERFLDKYWVVLETKSGFNSKGYRFRTKEDANNFVKSILKDKVLKNFRRVS